MVFTDISIFERIGRRNATIASSILAILVLLMLLINLPLEGKTPEEKAAEELGGVTVALGYPDLGSNNDTPSEGGGEQVPPDPTPAPPTPQTSTPSPATPPPAVITSEDPDVKYAREKAREDQKQRLKEQDDVIKKAKIEAEAKEAVKRAEQAKADAADAAEAKRLADVKAKIGNGFGKKPGSQGGTGTGSGNNGKPGNGGDKNGDPNSKNLEGGGQGDGAGRSIGGGLGSRAVQGSNAVSKAYNESGSVNVKVCVDESGKVTSATTQNVGTNTSSPTLRSLAEANAKSYRFAPGDGSTCGTILYQFRVK